MLAEREMSKVELRKLAGIAPATFTKLRRNQEVALSVLMKIADVLDCDAGDIMNFVKEEKEPTAEGQDKWIASEMKKDRNVMAFDCH